MASLVVSSLQSSHTSTRHNASCCGTGYYHRVEQVARMNRPRLVRVLRIAWSALVAEELGEVVVDMQASVDTHLDESERR